jgi:hypothetical protein
VFGDHVVFEVLETGLNHIALSLIVILIVFDDFLKVERVSCSEENILNCGGLSGLFGLLLLETLIITELVVVTIVVVVLVFVTRFPLSVSKIFILRLLVLVDADLHVGVGCVDGTGRSDNLAVDDTRVDLFEKFDILTNVNGGGPLVSNTEDEFLKEVLVHHG